MGDDRGNSAMQSIVAATGFHARGLCDIHFPLSFRKCLNGLTSRQCARILNFVERQMLFFDRRGMALVLDSEICGNSQRVCLRRDEF